MKIEIFGKEKCSFCTDAKNLLNIKKMEFEYTDFFTLSEEDQNRLRTVRAPGAASFPIILVEDTYIGGFAQLKSAIN